MNKTLIGSARHGRVAAALVVLALVNMHSAAHGGEALLPPPPARLASTAGPPPNTMLPPVPRDAKRQWARLFMLFNPLSVRDLLNIMAHKVAVAPGRDIETVVETLIARAERHGFLLVDRYPMWRELQRLTGEADPYKVEVISLCDPRVSRDWMDYAPEMALFVPPRIAVVEDRERRLWLIMLDWDMRWIDTARHAGFDAELRADGLLRREMLEDILQAAANGTD